MGIDLSYQAIPHDSPALERARRDAEFGCELEFWNMRADHKDYVEARVLAARVSTKPEDIAFVDAVDLARAAREHPGIESRRWAWSRGYDAAHYLLSPERRDGRDEEDWTHTAIYGAQVLGEGVTTIGFKIRYTPPNLVREHAELLQLVTQDDLREHFDAEAMSRSVYKYWGDADGFENWMWPEFEAWRDFLVSMLDFPDEGLICCVG